MPTSEGGHSSILVPVSSDEEVIGVDQLVRNSLWRIFLMVLLKFSVRICRMTARNSLGAQALISTYSVFWSSWIPTEALTFS